jgi:steroid delta-isomerase-like uncharacterized protein
MSEEQSATGWPQQYMDAWSSHDGAKVASFMTEDVVYTDLALDERFEGPDAVREFVNDVTESLSTDYGFTLGQVVVTDDSYAFEWTMFGTNNQADEKRGLPSTGKRFEIPGVSIGRLRDGKIAENHDYWNLVAYLTQVGLMPAPGGAAQ